MEEAVQKLHEEYARLEHENMKAQTEELRARTVLWSELSELVRFAEKFLCVVAKEKGVKL